MQKAVLLGILAMVLAATLGRAASDNVSRLSLQVVTGESKKPVANAHVVIRFVAKKFLKDKRTTWESKTNRKGIVTVDNIPQGTVKIQVIARGFQTYGDEHELNEPEEELIIRLNPPRSQVSAY